MGANMLRTLRGFWTRVGRGPGRCAADGATSAGLLEPPTRADIVQGYRFILGREPESERVIAKQMQHPSVAAFRLAALGSVEFRHRYRAIGDYAVDGRNPRESQARRTVAFIHLPKTGGSTLSDFLAKQFEPERICPNPNLPLYCFTVAELARYDYFAGHFEFDSMRYIPRQNIQTVSMFREPAARLVSLYRFLRTHSPSAKHTDTRLIQLANDLTAEEFFESPEVRAEPGVFNNYLLVFGRSLSWFADRLGSVCTQELEAAVHEAEGRIRALTALGITERFDLSVRHICSMLELAPPRHLKPTNVTDKKRSLHSRFRRVDRVNMTPRLAAALEELTVYDRALYRFAVHEFERRCTRPEGLERWIAAAEVQPSRS
jgi:hypothetical protein